MSLSAQVQARPARAPTPLRAARRHPIARWYYLAATLVMMAMVARGFWPSYVGPLVRGGVQRFWVIHLHGAVFAGWMVLFLIQAALIAGGETAVHRRIGNVLGIAYGVLVLALGLTVSFVAPVLHVRAGEWTVDRAAGFLIYPLVDMVLWAGFFSAAIAYRKKPELHKRLILAATVALAFAGASRMNIQKPLLFLVLWLSPLLGAMALDLFVRRRVHPVHWISLAVLCVAFVRIFFEHSAPWLRIGRALLAPVL